MQIILAVDLTNGKVVKAFAGLRINYKPLFLNNIEFSDPIKLIQLMKKKINLKKVYLADLDSIKKIGSNNKLIEKILKRFPDLTFLIDAGFDYPISTYYYHKDKEFKKLNNYTIILGTETLKNFHPRSFKILKKFQLSLDFNGKQKIWLKKINRRCEAFKIILMFINQVGGRGINMKLIKKIKKDFPLHSITVAGGIKTNNQIIQLSRMGIKSVISSTLVHKWLSRDRSLVPRY